MKARCSEIDGLYTIGILLVILGHSHPSDWTLFGGTVFESVISFIYVFHMPLFFFISGFLFRHSGSLRKKGYGIWLGEKTIRLLTPYLFWSLLALIPKYYLEYHSCSGMIRELGTFLLNPRLGVWGHFWFLPTIWSLFLVFGLVDTLTKDRTDHKLDLACLVLGMILYAIPTQTNVLGINDFRQFAVYFAAGIVVRSYLYGQWTAPKPVFRWMLSILGLSISVLLFLKCSGNKEIMLLTALIMILVCLQPSAWIGQKGAGIWISHHNFTIYLFSWLFQAAVMWFTGRLGFSWQLMSVLMFFAGIAGPAALCFIYEKCTPIHNRLFDLVLGFK